MKIRWAHFDTFFAKLTAFVVVVGAVWWMVYSVRDHYHSQHVCKCVLAWEYLPFVVGGLGGMFSLAILSQKATAAAAAIVLPFVDRLRLGKETTSSVIVPAQPATPATVVTTTTTPLPTVQPLPPNKGEAG